MGLVNQVFAHESWIPYAYAGTSPLVSPRSMRDKRQVYEAMFQTLGQAHLD